MYIFLFVG